MSCIYWFGVYTRASKFLPINFSSHQDLLFCESILKSRIHYCTQRKVVEWRQWTVNVAVVTSVDIVWVDIGCSGKHGGMVVGVSIGCRCWWLYCTGVANGRRLEWCLMMGKVCWFPSLSKQVHCYIELNEQMPQVLHLVPDSFSILAELFVLPHLSPIKWEH